MVQVYGSRFTPGIKAHETRFSIGDVVTYRLLDGRTEVRITIQSEFMHHVRARIGGYEAIFPDGKLCFADVERIVDWRGKDSG